MKTFKRIVVGITFDSELHAPTRAAERATLQATWVAQHSGGHVTLLHSPLGRSSVAGGAFLGDSRAHVSRAAQPLLDALAKADVPHELVIDDDRPWLALTRRAVNGEADLVVVGTRVRPAVGAVPLGTNTRKLLRQCPCPVWVVHPWHEMLRRAVLVATDLTPVGQRAMGLAAQLANEWKADLHVVHALELASQRKLEHGIEEKRRFSKLASRKEAEAREHVAQGLPPTKNEARVHIGSGPATEVILEQIEQVDPDIVVMGTVSRSGLAGFMIGNTAERLLDRIDCSLLTVKPQDFRSPIEVDG